MKKKISNGPYTKKVSTKCVCEGFTAGESTLCCGSADIKTPYE